MNLSFAVQTLLPTAQPGQTPIDTAWRSPQNTKYLKFLARYAEDPYFDRTELADDLHVTRQTIHSWLRLTNSGKPYRPRGRAPRYPEQRTVRIAVTIPEFVAKSLLKNEESMTRDGARKALAVAIERVIIAASCDFRQSDGCQLTSE